MPSDKVTRFLAAAGYSATIKDAGGNDIPNPITASAFSKNWVLDAVKTKILRYEAEVALTAAETAALNQDLSDIN